MKTADKQCAHTQERHSPEAHLRCHQPIARCLASVLKYLPCCPALELALELYAEAAPMSPAIPIPRAALANCLEAVKRRHFGLT